MKCHNTESSSFFISIIIPVRNEEQYISDLIKSIDNQSLNKSFYEVIVVNDHSDDSTVSLIEDYIKHGSLDLKLIDINDIDHNVSHKKYAITKAINQAKGDIIVTVDGDCIVKENWLVTIKNFFEQQNTVFATGPVAFKSGPGFFKNLQILEFASLIGIGASTLAIKQPTMCNGANMAFLKEKFFEVEGYEGVKHIPSGDDEFLMHKLFKKYPDQVLFIKSKDAIVETHAKSSLRSFIDQRIRWAGKWKYHRMGFYKFLAIHVFLVYLSFFLGLLLLSIGVFPVKVFLAIILIKTVVEYAFVSIVMSFLGKRVSLLYFFSLTLLYPFYTFFFGLISQWKGYHWKGRSYTS